MTFLSKHKLAILIIVFCSLLQGIALYVSVLHPLSILLPVSAQTYDHVKKTKENASAKDVAIIADDLGLLRTDIQNLNVAISQMPILKFVPVVAPFFAQKEELISIVDDVLSAHQTLVREISPYSVALGITQSDAQGQYLENFLKVSSQIIPILDKYLTNIEPILTKVTNLDVSRLPTFPVDLQAYAREGVSYAQIFDDNLPEIKTFVAHLPDVMGATQPKHYLVLFQNDKELRPTGGFITSYTTVTINAGDITFSDASNIYDVQDGNVYYASPYPIATYLTERIWHLRDANFSPDFKESMDFFYTFWRQVGQQPFDGIIAVDTQLVSALLKFTGDVNVPGYDIDFGLYPSVPQSCKSGGSVFTSENVVCRLEFYAERASLGENERKDVIGLLMNQMYDHIMATDSSSWQDLIMVITTQLNEKHALLYFTDDVIQTLAEEYNVAGRVRETESDYLLVNDANLAGLKSDMYLTRSVDQYYEVSSNGTITKTVDITYENTGAFDGWLNATARNYVRLYVPEGSTLLSSSGGEATVSVSSDLGKTVFDNFVRIPPMSSSTVSFTYEIPIKVSNDFSVLIQKQPGKELESHRVFVNDEQVSTVTLRSDMVVPVSL